MSIRPTDLQILVQKAHEVERLQQSQQQQQRVQQQQVADKLHKQHEVQERQITSAPHADEVKIKNRERQSGKPPKHNEGQAHSKSAPDDEHEQTGAESAEHHIIDIKI